eukprot:GFUD01137560.1.p1 GENE.GFUD01137560.1~~GFUD01137560.1.p1  ORF type:complete len:978 (-),score=275.67 GFUD01137560.1:72-3005(-)
MCAMPLSAAILAGMTSDPRTGVVAQHRSVHIVIEKDKISVMKEALIKKLNKNVNKFYPDAGGIMMGYQGIKMKRSTCEVNSLPLLHPVHIRAQFYLFRPQVGSEVTCVVTSREEGRVKCLVHSVFEVEVLSPPECWDTVLVGQTVVVKVEAVEQMAWQEPKIIATLLDTRDNVAPLIDIVENLEVEEFESVTDSGMFEYEQNSVSNSGRSGGVGMRGDRSGQVGCEEREVIVSETRNTSASQYHHVGEETSLCDGVSKSKAASKKRKIKDVNSTSVGESISPVMKKTRRQSKSSSVASGTSPTSQSSYSDPNTDLRFPVTSSQYLSATPPPSPLKSKNPVSSPAMSKPSPSSGKSKNIPSQSGSTDDEDSKVEQRSKRKNPTVPGISKTTSTPANNTEVPNLLAFEPLLPPTPKKLPEAIVASKTPTIKRGKSLIPPGFKSVLLNKNGLKLSKPKLIAPDGSIFRGYKSAWVWADDHPDYLVKSEPLESQSAPQSVASGSMSGRSSPDMFNSQPDPLEITPCVNEGEASEKSALVSETNANESKQHKNDVPTPIVKAGQQKLLVDQPSLTESKPEPPQSQSLLLPESDTDYQSQSLLPPPSIIKKKTVNTGKNATKESVNKSPRNLQSDKAIIDRTSKTPCEPSIDDGKDSGAESSFEGTKHIAALPPSKKCIPKSPSKNVDASRTSSNSSSEDSSSDEEPPTQRKPVVDNVPVKKSLVPTSDDDSSSFESGSDTDTSDDDTVTAPKYATGPSETVLKKEKPVSSSDSDSDSSDESDLEVDKFRHQVTVIVTDPVKTGPTLQQPTEIVETIPKATKEVSKPVKGIDNKTTSSSDSEENSSQPPVNQKKLTKKKNSPKLPNKNSPAPPVKNSPNTSVPKTTMNTSGDKSPHLSSTVMTGVNRFRDKMLVPDGISPILKTRHKPKSGGEKSGISYFDQVMATSKMGSQKSDTKSAEYVRSASDKNVKKKKKKEQIAGFL